MNEGLLAYAFTLGLVAAVNPCGFALLPVYLPSFARADDTAAPTARRIMRAVRAALLASAGFGVVFGAVGAAVSAGAVAITRWVPWVMIVIAVAMMAAGAAGLAGRPLAVPGRLAGLVPRVRGRSARSMLTFGVGYGIASLSCALPVFLAGIAGAFLRADLVAGLASFLAYALGMATVFTALAVAITLGWRARPGRLRRLSRYIHPLSSALLVAVGGYLAYYWVTLLAAPVHSFPLTGLIESIQADLARWLAGAGVWAGAGVAAAVGLVLLGTWLARRVGARAAITLTSLLPALLVPAALVRAGALGAPARPQAAVSGLGAGSGDPHLSKNLQYLTTYTPIQAPTPAPGFTLTGQYGRRVSLASLRGKIVVLAFLDDECTDICPLYARDMLAAARDLGPLARKAEFVGVNVNPFYPGVADVAGFTRREHLNRLPDWHFLTGPPAALKKVWRAYGETVELDWRGRAVQHQGTIYFLDARGRERAGMDFGTPTPAAPWGQAIATVIAGLAGAPVPPAARGPAPASSGGGPGITVAGHGTAPGFRLPRLRHPAQHLALAGLSGKPLVLNFWASWCTPCLKELPVFQKVAARWRGRVNFAGIDTSDQQGSALRVARQAGLAYPLGFDRAGTAAATYKVVNLPTTFFISASGHILARHTGEMTQAGLTRAIRALTQRAGTG